MLSAVSLACMCTFAQIDVEPVRLAPGPNELMDIGRYEVAYRLGDAGEWVTMPIGWSGHFLPGVGVSCSPWQPAGSLLLHSPWMNGWGVTEVRYHLTLPETTPIALSFAYAMGPDLPESDGVTFGAAVRTDAGERVLLSEHTKSPDWTPVTYDLSEYAGQTIALVFSVHPGPAHSPSWDYSLFRAPTLVVGEGAAESLPERLARLREARAQWGAAPPARAFVNRSDRGVAASTAGECETSLARVDAGWAFTCTTGGRTLTYSLDADGDLASLAASYDGGETTPLSRARAFTLADADDAVWSLREARVEGDRLVVEGALISGDSSADVRCALSLIGKTLLIEADSAETAIRSFTGPSAGAAAWRRSVRIPYLTTGRVDYLPDQSLYVGAILDWTSSSASRHDGVTAHYEALSDGSRNPLHERAAVTVSPFIGEVLPNIPNPACPFIEDLSRRVVVDDWSGDFAATRTALDQYAAHGVRDALVQIHVWQNGGYDAKLPDVLPANEGMGGDAEMIRLADAARAHGYLFGVHENYVDIYPDAPSWDEDLVARDAAGNMIKAWLNEGTGVQSYGYRADAIVPTAERFTHDVHDRYGTTCSFIDVHAAVPPWFHVDFTAGEPGAGKFAPVWDAHLALWRLFREAHDGPVLGEGNNHFFWSGRLDGVEAQVENGESHRPFADFELLKVHPLMLNHGMGYVERWLTEGYNAGIQSRMALVRADKYRTQEILYGHAGFIAAAWVREPLLAVKEAHMMRPLQERYGAAQIADIAYLVAGEWVDSSTALALGETSLARVAYENGFVVIVNQSDAAVEANGKTIPPYGFHATAPDGLEAYTAEVDGQIVDCVSAPDGVFVDARGYAYHPRLTSGSALASLKPGGALVRPTGPRRFEITYTWDVRETLGEAGEGLGCFVHFVREDAAENREGIVFQNDHGFAAAPGEWPAGEVFSDGPHAVTIGENVPPGEYTIRVGLLRAGARQMLGGPQDGTLRYIVGSVILAEDGTVTVGRTGPPAADTDPLAVYDARYNTERKPIDFGPVVTNGAAKVETPDDGRSIVYPLPQEVAFDLALRMPETRPGQSVRCAMLDATGARVETRVLTVGDDGLLPLPTGRESVCAFELTPEP